MNTYGVWGLGIVGKSVIRFLHGQGHRLSAYDARTLSPEEEAFLSSYHVRLYKDNEFQAFLEENQYLVPSPGIALAPAQAYLHKMVHELDLFALRWKKPLIAVTGSLGKTTLVTLLTTLLQANQRKVATGGNIGTAMLDLLEEQDTVDYGLLELSSFQLEHARHIAPDLAIITNLYANHLDRHGTMEEYFRAKAHIFAHQRPGQQVLLRLNLAHHASQVRHRPYTYFSKDEPSQELLGNLKNGDSLYTLSGSMLIKRHYREEILTTTTIDIPAHIMERGKTLLTETWLIILAASDMLGKLTKDTFTVPELTPLEHRIEFVGSYGGILFYNDSKSTIVEATCAAVATLAPKPIHLILGGLSKGVDRTPLISGLKPYVATTACFGKEAQNLDKSCKASGIPSSAHETLEDALRACVQQAQKDAIILLSPSGASYDLYKDYQERGRHFKKLVKELYDR